MSFTPRTTAPAKSNKYYKHVDGGGLNRCIKISGNDCLANCVGYCHGRVLEISKAGKPIVSLPVNNAEDWIAWAKAHGYKILKKPKAGTVACYSKGKVGVGSDGAGHVRFVEQVFDDGTILFSESGYGCSRFWNTKSKAPYGMSGYKLLGFIDFGNATDKVTKTEKITYKVGGSYKVLPVEGLNLRKTADVSGKILKIVPQGTKVKCLKVSKDWIKIEYKGKTGYICCKLGSKVYVK